MNEAKPFYQSKVFLLVLTAAATRLIAVFPNLALWIGLTTTTLNAYVTAAVVGIGLLFDGLALRARASSSGGPLTSSQAKADAINAGAALQSIRTPPQLAVLALTLMCSAMLVGCAVGKGLTFQQSINTARQSEAAVLLTVDTLLNAHKISSADAENVEKQVDNLDAALNIAESVHATDEAAGGSKLQTAIAALGGLQQYLATLDKKGK